VNKLKLVIGILAIALVIESAVVVALYVGLSPTPTPITHSVYVVKRSIAIPFQQFNQPISNDTEYKLEESIDRSWAITIQSQLVPSSEKRIGSEAQIAIAPEYPSENLSIPTLIVQERGDGLLRIEYFAQNWPNTYGLVLYNSTSPTWQGGHNVTLKFTSYGPPAPVNPQIAPHPNGNLTILVGNIVVVSDYPIAWANLSSLYIYGLRGSSFTAGTMYITIYQVEQRS
jgi:hypothetical protein